MVTPEKILYKEISNITAMHHFTQFVMPTMTDALANVASIADKEIRAKTAQAYLVTSFITLAGFVSKDTLNEVTAYLRKEGLI